LLAGCDLTAYPASASIVIALVVYSDSYTRTYAKRKDHTTPEAYGKKIAEDLKVKHAPHFTVAAELIMQRK